MMTFFRKNWQFIILIFLAVVFSIIYLYLGVSIKGDLYGTTDTKLVFNSPDETANYFFSYLFAAKSQLNYLELDNFTVAGLIAPRSMRFINGSVAPTSFFGLMIILGLIAKLFSTDILVFIIPIISAFSLLFFYLLIKNLFNKEIAFLSTLAAFTFPAYWYYASRSFFNNILFLDFFIIGLYFFVNFIRNKNYFVYFISGYFLGLAIFVRTSEVFWVSFLLLIIILFNLKKIKILGMIIFIIAVFLSWFPIFYYNQQIYGQIFSIGYNYNFFATGESILGSGISLIKQLLLPFGLDWLNIKTNFMNYFVELYWWYFILLEIGLGFILTRIFDNQYLKNTSKLPLFYFLLFIFISIYLIILYGSWKFNDHPDPQAVTLGTSYNRYFLPIYIFSLPLIFYFINNIFSNRLIKHLIYVLVILIFYLCSYQLVFLDKDEGLLKVKANILEYQLIASQIIPVTSKTSIIIAERNDKIFFPMRSVIYQLANEKDKKLIGLLLKKRDIYWWRFKLNDEDIKYINNTNKQNGYQWSLDKEKLCYKNQCLYQLVNIN